MADIEHIVLDNYDALKYTDGYPIVAEFTASDPDHESFIFRRFNTLTARRLLYLQSELLDLERQQAALDRAVACSEDHELHSSLRTWEKFSSNSKRRDEEKKRKELADEIDLKLEKYRRLKTSNT